MHAVSGRVLETGWLLQSLRVALDNLPQSRVAWSQQAHRSRITWSGLSWPAGGLQLPQVSAARRPLLFLSRDSASIGLAFTHVKMNVKTRLSITQNKLVMPPQFQPNFLFGLHNINGTSFVNHIGNNRLVDARLPIS